MIIRKVLFIIFAVAISTLFLCCDIKGSLSNEETDQLYREIKQEIINEEIWNKNIYFEKSDYSHDSKKNTLFLQSVINTVLEKEDMQTKVSGDWFDSKKYCKILKIMCEITYDDGGTEYTIDQLYIQKYYDSVGYIISLYYHDQNIDTASRITAIISEE